MEVAMAGAVDAAIGVDNGEDISVVAGDGGVVTGCNSVQLARNTTSKTNVTANLIQLYLSENIH